MAVRPASLLTPLLHAGGVMLGVALLVFALIHVVPGDPVDALLGESAAATERAALRAELGLDRPLWAQLADYLAGLVQLDLGRSLHGDAPVAALIGAHLPATLQLAGAAALCALLLAVPLGTLAAWRPGSMFDRSALWLASLGAALPAYCLGPLLILLFSFGLGWLPVSGRDEPGALVLPALTLSLGMAAVLARLLRATLLEALAEDYLRTARAKGLSAMAVLWRHALPNALVPLVTLFGLQLGHLLGGAVITETVFAWPGLGRLTVEAIERRDYPLVQGCVLAIAAGYVLANAATELALRAADPRQRSA